MFVNNYNVFYIVIIKYIPLQQGLRRISSRLMRTNLLIIKYIPLQQGLRLE